MKTQAERRLTEEQIKLTQAQRGHLRLSLVERIIVFASWVTSIPLAAIGILPLLLVALVIGGGLSASIGLAVVRSRIREMPG